jgi:hypothetical protein
MRLSDWRASPPTRESMTLKVLAVVEPVLTAMGAEKDPSCWVVWGDDPAIRYTILVPTPSGLVTCGVRVNIPGEGPRASAKLVRWNRVQLGELAVETQAGHRVTTFQVEQHVLRGADAAAERIAGFAMALFAAVDGRPTPNVRAARSRRPGKAAAGRRPASGVAASRSAPKPMARTVRPETDAQAEQRPASSA